MTRCSPARRRTLRLTLLAAIASAALGGCGSPGGGRSFEIAAGGYAGALDATRETLRDAGYTVERVDASAGEVTTAEKTVAGLATPGASENRSFTGFLADTLSDRPRTLRVRFRDASDRSAPPRADAPVHAEVDAIVWRRLNPNWRTETETVMGNFVWRDPLLAERGVTGATRVPLKRDDDLAAVIARRIESRLSESN